MTKREPLMTVAYFDQDIDLISEYIQKRLENMPSYQNKAMAQFQIVRYRFSLISAKYSRGFPVGEIREEFLRLIEDWETLYRVDTENQFVGSFKNDIGSYVEAIGLLSRAYLLQLDSSAISRLLLCLGSAGEDVLFERLVEAGQLSVARKPAKKLLYPKVYQSLYDALDASAEQQPALVQQFLQDWYKRIKNVGWHNAHLGPDGGGFVGYWCWEAAGVALAFGIDDASFREMPYYPTDLADYARAAG